MLKNALPNGNLIESKDLNLCPRQMPCPLNLDLFDTTLQVKSYPYTVDDHQHYLASLDFKVSAASFGIKTGVRVTSTPSQSKSVSGTKIIA